MRGLGHFGNSILGLADHVAGLRRRGRHVPNGVARLNGDFNIAACCRRQFGEDAFNLPQDVAALST